MNRPSTLITRTKNSESNLRPWSVDSGHGGSGDVMKIPPIEKKI